jgi:membrane-associated phospholipid phosphatase
VRPRPVERYGARATLLGLALLLVAVPFGVLLVQVVTRGELTELDASAANSMSEWVRPRRGLIEVLDVLTDLGTGPWLWLLMSAVVVGLWRRSRRLAVYAGLTALGGSVLSSTVKVLVGRDRPGLPEPLVDPPDSASFPSGHAVATTVCYGVLLVLLLPQLSRRRRPWLVVGYGTFVVTIGLTRLLLGVHYLTDVVGGVVLGVAWLCVSTAAFDLWRPQDRAAAAAAADADVAGEAETERAGRQSQVG